MMLIFKKIFWYKVFFLIPKRLENIIKIIIRLRYYSFPYFDILIYNMGVCGCVCVCVCVCVCRRQSDTDNNYQRDWEIWNHTIYSLIFC